MSGRLVCFCSIRFKGWLGYVLSSRGSEKDKEAEMPVWAWVLIIVLLVLLLTGGVYVRR